MTNNNFLLQSSIKSIYSKITRENALDYLVKINIELSDGVDIKEGEKEQFIEKLREINDKLRRYTPEHYHFYIKDNPEFISKNKKNETLIETLRNVIIQTLINHSMEEFTNNLEKEDKNENQGKVTQTALLCNALFRIRDLELNDYMIKIIGYSIDEEGLKDFLNFIIKMDFKKKAAEENEEKFNANILDYIDLIFIYIKLNNAELYSQLLKIVHSEKKYFKRILIKNMPDVHMDKIYTLTRDYNFDILTSLYDKRPHLIEETIRKVSNNDILIPRKSYIEKLVEYDQYFAQHIKKLDLGQVELIDLCNKSDMFLENFFLFKAGSMYEFCKIFADKGEQYILDFIKKHVEHENMPILIKNMSYTIRLTGGLKEYILDQFSYKKEYFNSLLPFLTFDQISDRITDFYEPKGTLEALIRKYHPGDLLIELHKLKDKDVAVDLIKETLENDKFTDNDFVFLLKFLESADCEYKYKSVLATLQGRKSLKKHCIEFLVESPGDTTDMDYIQCLEHSDTLKVFEAIPTNDLCDLVKHNKNISKILKNLLKENKKLSKKMRDIKNKIK